MVIYVFNTTNNDIRLYHCVHIRTSGKKIKNNYVNMILPKDCMFYLNNKFNPLLFANAWHNPNKQAQQACLKIMNSSKEISREQAFIATNDVLYAIKLLKEG